MASSASIGERIPLHMMGNFVNDRIHSICFHVVEPTSYFGAATEYDTFTFGNVMLFINSGPSYFDAPLNNDIAKSRIRLFV